MADEEQTSLMDDLATAWDAAEEETVEESTEGQAEPAAIEGEATIEGDSVPDVAAQEPETEQLAEPEPGEPAPEIDSAPRGLSPAAREEWNNTPEAVRNELAKREADFEKGIQKYAEGARRAQQMDQVLAPYQNLFAMNGGAQNTLPGLLQTATALQSGSDQVRAQTIANLIQQFGVDVNSLADVLQGRPVQQQQPQVDIQAEIQRALQPIYKQQQQREIGIVQNALDRFASDPQNEFYNDVKGDMADLMDVAAQQGRNLELKEAYDKACMMRDDIRGIIQNRQSASEVQQRRAAASSISGSPQGHEAPPQPESITDFLNQAWDQVGNR